MGGRVSVVESGRDDDAFLPESGFADGAVPANEMHVRTDSMSKTAL
jgi:hypothetical protein